MNSLTAECELSGERFFIPAAEVELLSKLGEHNSWIGESLPLPRLKPCETVRQIFSLGNLMYLFRRKSSVSGKPILSRYSERDGYKVVSAEEFWSDEVDNLEFGRDYDFKRPFFVQFSELMRDVYHLALSRSNVENSEFVNGAQNSKNCYLCFSLLESSDCLYCLSQYYGNDNIDCAGTLKCQLCYSCRDIDNCYECQHCADCWSCHSCFGCTGCRSCSDCFGCYGLEHAKYCFFNEQLSKERYEQEIQKLRLGSFSGRSSAVAKCADFIAQSGFSPKRIINAEGCTGSYIFRSSNISSSYHTIETQDCGHMLLSIYSRDCWKGWASKGELCYSSGVIESTNVGYSYSVWGGEELWYSYFLYGASHCFGSAMLKNNRYCILNKQYSKSEYLELLPRIVSHMKSTGEWGRVVPASISPHPYSESFAKLYLEDLPLETLRRRGYRLEEAEEPVVEAAAIDSSSLPDDIADVEVTKLAGAVIRCAETGKNFNLQRAELEFYKKLSIPLPRRHWRVRLNELILARELMPEVLDLVGFDGD